MKAEIQKGWSAMPQENLGQKIAQLRKAKAMTQRDLAQQLHVTDKAVSKWEREQASPDIKTLPQIAEVLDVPVQELLLAREDKKMPTSEFEHVMNIALKAIPLALTLATLVLGILKELTPRLGFSLLSLAVFLLALDQVRKIKRPTS